MKSYGLRVILICLCASALFAFSACGSDEEEEAPIGGEIVKDGTSSFELDGSVKFKLPDEQWVASETYFPDSAEDGYASVMLVDSSDESKTLNVLLEPADGYAAELYEEWSSDPDGFKSNSSNSCEYGIIKTPLDADMYYVFNKADTVSHPIDEKGGDDEISEIQGIVKVGDDQYLSMTISHEIFEEGNTTITYKQLTEEDFESLKKIVGTLKRTGTLF